MDGLPIAIIGGGPIGLAAAAHIAERGLPFQILELGPEIAHAVRSWGHVRLFSPWSECIDGAARRLLDEAEWLVPELETLPTGDDLIDRYLAPLASHRLIAPNIRIGARVLAVGRRDFDKVRTAGRSEQPFEIELADGETLQARAVLDASGTWWQPNPLGSDGRPAWGEEANRERISYGIPNVLGSERERYAGRRTLVVGSGHSAMNAVLDLLSLRNARPGTAILWAVRRESLDKVFGSGTADTLPARGALGEAARRAIESGAIRLLSPFRIRRLCSQDDALHVEGTLADEVEVIRTDEIIAATGFRPNLDMLREVRLSLDPWLEAATALAPLIDPSLHNCGTVPPHGVRELMHPEADFYVVGAKSYGRAPTFLLLTGYEQVRSVVAALAGDQAAATRVEFSLSELSNNGVISQIRETEGTAARLPQPAVAEDEVREIAVRN